MISRATNRPWNLRVEHLDDAFGIDVSRPRLSWKLPHGAEHQFAHQVRTETWDSGRVESGDSVLVEYAGQPLRSRQRVTWQVRVWTDRGASHWSEAGVWEMGLLARADWSGQWIEPTNDVAGEPGRRPAHLVRTKFAGAVNGLPA